MWASSDEQAPTIALYCDKRFEPPIEVTGGVWYDENMDYDHAMVNEICNALYAHVYSIVSAPHQSRVLHSSLVRHSPSGRRLLPRAVR